MFEFTIPLTKEKPWPKNHCSAKYYSHSKYQLNVDLKRYSILIERMVKLRNTNKWQSSVPYYGIFLDLEGWLSFGHDKSWYDGEHHTFSLGVLCFSWYN